MKGQQSQNHIAAYSGRLTDSIRLIRNWHTLNKTGIGSVDWKHLNHVSKEKTM